MKVITIAGARETGKTTIAKKLIAKAKSVLVYDANNNYAELDLVHLKDITPAGKQRVVTTEFKLFMTVATKQQNKTVVFEEATIFFNSRTAEEDFKKLVISCRHSNVMLIFIFHSIMDIPKFVLRQTNYLYLKKTGDMENDVKYHRNQNVFDAWKLAMNNTDPYHTEVVKIV